MRSKVLNAVRRSVETAAQAKRAVCIEVALTNVAPIKRVVNAVRYMHTGIAQLLAKNAINVVTKIILVHVVDRT